jgi:type IV pilus modification protein PilV
MHNATCNSTGKFRPTESGTTLLEVLLAIVIFVVGMMALASLQGNLTRSSSDSNMRTVAANIAEETIEGLRAFEVIETEAGKKAYDDIVDKTTTVQRGGVNYTVVVDVNDYYFLDDRVSVSKTAPAGVTASSFKNIDLSVTWNSGIEFQIDEGTQTDDRLGGGGIAVASIIPAILSLNNAKVAAEDDGKPGYPPVDYTPGEKPEIIAISLGDNKFKESTKPDPEVIRNDELVETWFDVVTYSGTADDAVFLRREEFASISCECTLRAASGSGPDGRQPTTWNGAEYDEGAKVGKPFGESASNQQSQYCDVCCNDHHDTSRGPDSYRPGTSQANGDHKHYNYDNNGDLTETTVGKNYIEACRLIRKDGFFRVAQDFSLESQTAFPENYLDETQEVDDYSSYVTAAVDDHFTGNGSWPAHNLNFDGRDVAHPSALPTASSATSQQLRSRGIYVDVATPALLENLDYCFNNDGTPKTPPDNEGCPVKNATSPLELYPFFDVQLTLLSRWSDTTNGVPVEVTNEELESGNTHSRGLASLNGSTVGLSTLNSIIDTSNVGLIHIAPIALVPAPEDSTAQLYISANGGTTTPPDPGYPTISGNLSSQGGTSNAADVSVVGSGATCTKPTTTTFTCVLDGVTANPTVTIGNYYKNNASLIACSTLVMDTYAQGDSFAANWTRFFLPASTLTGKDIVISKAPC